MRNNGPPQGPNPYLNADVQRGGWNNNNNCERRGGWNDNPQRRDAGRYVYVPDPPRRGNGHVRGLYEEIRALKAKNSELELKLSDMSGRLKISELELARKTEQQNAQATRLDDANKRLAENDRRWAGLLERMELRLDDARQQNKKKIQETEDSWAKQLQEERVAKVKAEEMAQANLDYFKSQLAVLEPHGEVDPEEEISSTTAGCGSDVFGTCRTIGENYGSECTRDTQKNRDLAAMGNTEWLHVWRRRHRSNFNNLPPLPEDQEQYAVPYQAEPHHQAAQPQHQAAQPPPAAHHYQAVQPQHQAAQPYQEAPHYQQRAVLPPHEIGKPQPAVPHHQQHQDGQIQSSTGRRQRVYLKAGQDEAGQHRAREKEAAQLQEAAQPPFPESPKQQDEAQGSKQNLSSRPKPSISSRHKYEEKWEHPQPGSSYKTVVQPKRTGVAEAYLAHVTRNMNPKRTGVAEAYFTHVTRNMNAHADEEKTECSARESSPQCPPPPPPPDRAFSSHRKSSQDQDTNPKNQQTLEPRPQSPPHNFGPASGPRLAGPSVLNLYHHRRGSRPPSDPFPVSPRPVGEPENDSHSLHAKSDATPPSPVIASVMRPPGYPRYDTPATFLEEQCSI